MSSSPLANLVGQIPTSPIDASTALPANTQITLITRSLTGFGLPANTRMVRARLALKRDATVADVTLVFVWAGESEISGHGRVAHIKFADAVVVKSYEVLIKLDASLEFKARFLSSCGFAVKKMMIEEYWTGTES